MIALPPQISCRRVRSVRGAIGAGRVTLSPAGASIRSRRSKAMTVVPFPYSRRRHLVERHARAMRGLPSDEAGEYMTKVLERVCEDLEKMGIACADADGMILDFASAIGRELHGPDFRIQLDGAK